MKEQAIFGRIFRTAAQVRAAVSDFVARYNTCWRLRGLLTCYAYSATGLGVAIASPVLGWRLEMATGVHQRTLGPQEQALLAAVGDVLLTLGARDPGRRHAVAWWGWNEGHCRHRPVAVTEPLKTARFAARSSWSSRAGRPIVRKSSAGFLALVSGRCPPTNA